MTMNASNGITQPEIMREMVHGKIHRATVTSADLHYVGSVTIDADLLDAADIAEGQRVDIVDINNGSRLSTYTIAGERGSGVLQINGAAAHLVNVGDLVIIIAYSHVPESRVHTWKPSVVFVDAQNRIIETGANPGEVPEAHPAAQAQGLKSAGV